MAMWLIYTRYSKRLRGIPAKYLYNHLKNLGLLRTAVKIRWSSNEVFCTFLVEERQVEVRVCFARDHPLAPPSVSAPGALELAPSTNRIVFHIIYQNGMVVDALRTWLQALSSRVESAPQCYICYCRLEASSGRLPRLRCRQCANKFHHSCVRKWFSTSKKSTCPLCRSQL